MMYRNRQRGVTLVELIVAIVIIAVAIFSVLGLLSAQASHSGDAMIRSQATHVASAYLDEIMQKQFASQANPPGRANFNDVSDYNGLIDVGARDQFGNAVSGLNAFTVSVSVTGTPLGSSGAGEVKRVDVTVTHTTGVKVILSGYRTQYP
ncbi:MAG TPA: prepilin-type N-terminal cleavage/methylation domain-containing protein [Steroidobacteraceae bacterium]|nr:prepilin-type N-terminal cleavage/methylation domain-containing protein [Steroidobacteraceae bacterium]